MVKEDPIKIGGEEELGKEADQKIYVAVTGLLVEGPVDNNQQRRAKVHLIVGKGFVL